MIDNGVRSSCETDPIRASRNASACSRIFAFRTLGRQLAP